MTMLGLEQQKLWLVRWGTMSALVWAMNEENAELRVRHDCFDRRAPLYKVTWRPKIRLGEVVVLREATEEDKAVFLECGAQVPA